mgnify:CR=1 FL=1
MGDKDLSMTARKFMLKYVLKYTKDNWAALNIINKDVDKDILVDLKKDPNILDWILSEVFQNIKHEETLVVFERWIQGNVSETIYKIKGRYIRHTFNLGLGVRTPLHTYEFVKRKSKRVIVYEYEVIK